MKRKAYEHELEALQIELTGVQRWLRQSGKRLLVIFEGRDAAGKGGTIKAISDRLDTRGVRTVALSKPDDREAHAVVFPALRGAPSGRRRTRAVRPQLVQPRRGGAGDGLLQPGAVRAVPRRLPRVRDACSPTAAS